jgi:hypothetical protein
MKIAFPDNTDLPNPIVRRRLLDGRGIIVLLLIAYAAVWNYYDQKFGWVDAWRHMRVAAMTPTMIDMRGMLGAFENYRDGVSMEEIQNPTPGSQMVSFTYPETWMLFAPLGLTEAITKPLTIGVTVACLAAGLWFVGPLSILDGFIYGLITISPSLMLGVERGNGDLFIFLLVIAACVLVAMRGIVPRVIGYLLFLFSGALKIYPVAGLATALKSWKTAIIGVLCGLLFMAFVFVDRNDLRRVNAYTSRDASHSFGARVFTEAEDLPAIYGFGAVGAVMCVAALWAWTAKSELKMEEGRYGTAFLACCAMFAVCFLIGSNYVYRFRFFLLILPQALIWARQHSRPAIVLCVCMFLTVFASNEPRLFALSEPLNWVIFLLTLYYLLSSLFGNLKVFLHLHNEMDETEGEYLQPS